MYEKAYLILRNQFWNSSTEEIIEKVFDKNILISTIAKEELLNRNLENLEVSNEVLKQVILKLSIEQIYELITNHKGSKIATLASNQFDKILEIAEKNYQEAYFAKVNEGKKSKIYLLKK